MTPFFGTSRLMVHARPGDRRRHGSFSEIPSGHQLRPQMTTAMTRPVRRLPARARASRHPTMRRARRRLCCSSAREPCLRAVPPRRKAAAQTILYPTIARQILRAASDTSAARLADPAQRALAARHLQGGLLPGHLESGRARRPGVATRHRRALPEARSHEAVGLRRERQHAFGPRGVLELRAEAEREDRRRALIALTRLAVSLSASTCASCRSD